MSERCCIPILYTSNQTILEDGKIKNYKHEESPDLSLEKRISGNDLSGCTFVLNKELAEKIVSRKMPSSDVINFRLHDTWIYLVAKVTGKVIYDQESRILYRIHKNNVVGIRKTDVKERICRVLKIGKDKNRSNLRMKTATELLLNYPEMDDDSKNVLSKYAYYQKSWKQKKELLHDKRIIKASGENEWIFRIKVLINFV